MTVVTNMHKT